jgi:hypothetical protein
VEFRSDSEVGRTEHCPGRLRTPGSGADGIVERRDRHRALSDRHERRVLGWKVGAEEVVEPRGVDWDLHTAVRRRGRAHKRSHRERREASLEVVDRLALVRREAGDVYEPGDLVRGTGDGDQNTAVRMAREYDRAETRAQRKTNVAYWV